MYYIGLDIQTRRDCSYAVLDNHATLIDSGWFPSTGAENVEILKKWSKSGRIYVGIDAPRMPLITKRKWYWNRKKRVYSDFPNDFHKKISSLVLLKENKW